MSGSSEYTVTYLVNYHYGKLRLAVGEYEKRHIMESSDGWYVVDKITYNRLRVMYDAGIRDLRNKIIAEAMREP